MEVECHAYNKGHHARFLADVRLFCPTVYQLLDLMLTWEYVVFTVLNILFCTVNHASDALLFSSLLFASHFLGSSC